MKELKRDLQSVLKSLRALTQKTGKMIFSIVLCMALTEKGFEGRIQRDNGKGACAWCARKNRGGEEENSQ